MTIKRTQKQKLDKVLELCCWLHNYLLEQFRERNKRGGRQLTEYQLTSFLTNIKKIFKLVAC